MSSTTRTIYPSAASSTQHQNQPIEFFECCAPFERGCDTVEEFKSQRTTQFYACTIPAEHAQQTMQQFNKQTSAFNLPQEFVHLKRITKPPTTTENENTASESNNTKKKCVMILLCSTTTTTTTEKTNGDDDDQNNLITTSELNQKLSSELSYFSSNSNNFTISTVTVPLFPQTPKEWVFANTVWPLSMPRLHRTVRDTDPSLLSENSKKAAWTGFNEILKEQQKCKEETMVAVVVNLENGCVIASCSQSFSKHEIEKIGGTVRLPYSFSLEDKTGNGDDDEILANSNNENNNKKSISSLHQHVTFEVLRKVSKLQAENNAGYLCNQLALVTSHEPCVMCSMGLVHSRISMAFYEVENKVHGGLGGSTMTKNHHHFVNRIPSLNHRFPTYRIARVK